MTEITIIIDGAGQQVRQSITDNYVNKCIAFVFDKEFERKFADMDFGILPPRSKWTSEQLQGYVLTVGSEHNSPVLTMQSPVLTQLKKLKCGYVLTMWTQEAWQAAQPAIDYMQQARVCRQDDGGLAFKPLNKKEFMRLLGAADVLEASHYSTVKTIKSASFFMTSTGSAFVPICGNGDAWVKLFRSVEDSGIDHAKILPITKITTNYFLQGVLIENADEQFLKDLESAIVEAKEDAKKFNRGNWIHHPVNRLVLRKFLHQNPDFAAWLIQDKGRMSAWDTVVPVEEWKVVQPTFGSAVPEERSVAAKQVAHGFEAVEEPVCADELPLAVEPVCAEELPQEEEPVCADELPQEEESVCAVELPQEEEPVCADELPQEEEEPKCKIVTVSRKRPRPCKAPVHFEEDPERENVFHLTARKSPAHLEVEEEEPTPAPAPVVVAVKQPMMRHHMMLHPNDSDDSDSDDDEEDPYADSESDASENKKKREREPVDELDALEDMDFGEKQVKLDEDDTRSPENAFDTSKRPVSPLTDRPIEPLVGSEILAIN